MNEQQGLATATGRRQVMRSLGASGLALLSTMGLANAATRSTKRGGHHDKTRRGKGKRQSAEASPRDQAVQSDAGAMQDDAVQAERRRRRFTTRKVIGASSAQLQAAAGSFANGVADCGGEGKVLSCGYETSATNEQLLNVFVTSVGPNPERSRCDAIMRRTTGTGSVAGANIRAVAICRG